jgi:hypothetical protein
MKKVVGAWGGIPWMYYSLSLLYLGQNVELQACKESTSWSPRNAGAGISDV